MYDIVAFSNPALIFADVFFSVQESVTERSDRTTAKPRPTSTGLPIGHKLAEVTIHAAHEGP
jgi:hypothetical protein